ncbi:DEAD/DEAH box helicase [Dyella caseinilytica]|uniref:DEAD/DEAH box helicase family protein n=1 Tax=Dyella caseinilytica TaxID=1849581 RepID=A0ABX7GPS9_9GAMM|nr:DEAD/DEAH box helicase [Dyella caseinilytica]QRN52432.1 DEAD/DEAH box helicase family protein [Dyella caseinilytica]GGA05943.1 hypothetical protein GCM10011408_28600 [Dyella caseinilytica]
MQLRWYQQDAKAAFWNYLEVSGGNPALVLPTGAGKSPLMAGIAMDAVQKWDLRIGILAANQELVEQNAAKLRAMWPNAPMGIYAAGLRKRDRFDKIQYMQIQSVYDKAHMLGQFDLLLTDEAQRIPLDGEGAYLRFFADAQKINQRVRFGGLTATPYRLKGRAIPICGPEYILNDIAYEARIPDLIGDAYLSKLVTPGGLERPDLSAVHVKGGEYVEDELAAAMIPLVERSVRDMLARSVGRKAGIIFCVNVKHAEMVMHELRKYGESCAMITGNKKITPVAQRRQSIEAFKAGRIRWMVNVNVLSEGFDAPHIDVVVMKRPTKSPGLMYQQIGRGFRVVYAKGYAIDTVSERLAAIAAGGKDDCLVLDYAGNLLEHGPVDQIKVGMPSKKTGKREVETGKLKECPTCKALLPMSTRECPEMVGPDKKCGHKFGSAKPQHYDTHVDAPILSTGAGIARKIHTHQVSGVRYAMHAKPGKITSLKVTYSCGMRSFSEWMCFEHGGMARMKAVDWWQKRLPGSNAPRTIEEALTQVDSLATPISIAVDETEKFPEIKDYDFGQLAERGGESATADSSAKYSESSVSPPRSNTVPPVSTVPDWLLFAVENAGAGKRAA